MEEARNASILIVTGEGKGKTTTALGLAVQAAAQERKVRMVQFLKGGGYTGELESCRYFGDNFEIYQFGFGCPIAFDIKNGQQTCTKCGLCFRENRNPARDYAGLAFKKVQELAADVSVSLLIMDEVSHAINRGLLSLQSIVQLISERRQTLDMVLTGRNMPVELLELADSAIYCHAVKHPMQLGIDARRGIEY